MQRIRGKDTLPEMIVRKTLHGLGFRYRLHAKELPGKPDVVFRPQKKAILVHGCYWHGHGCSRGGSGAKTNQEYWGPKIARNRGRDERQLKQLCAAGWKVLVIWECEVKAPGLADRLQNFLREQAG